MGVVSIQFVVVLLLVLVVVMKFFVSMQQRLP